MNDFDSVRAFLRPCPSWQRWPVVLLTLGILAAGSTACAQGGTKVTVLKTPHGGIQPQAVVDARGTLHLSYFKGEASAGDLFYLRREKGQARFSQPLRINSQAGSAIATGTVRGGQLALGKGGRIHVAWNGSGKALPKSPGKYASPMLYSRLGDAGTAFEDQRNLMQLTTTLDGGGTVAADRAGNVYVSWHASQVGSPAGEDQRQVWLAFSADEGKTFAKEFPVNTKPTGACGCCSMRAFSDSNGSVYLLYRSATDSRDVYLLSGKEQGKSFQGVLVHPWRIST